jgi:hypothetical protein
MRIPLASSLIIGCIGAALGWIAHSALQQPERQTSASPTSAKADTARPQPIPEPPRAHADAQMPESDLTAVSPGAPKQTSKGAAFVLVPDRTSDAPTIGSGDHTASATSAPVDANPLTDLLAAMTIWCRFDPGNGAHLRGESISMYELAYQGGPVTYDSIDMDSGTARMTGSEGATGSLEGVLDVLATRTRAGLHFSAFNSRGELVVTTVFGAVDTHGRHLAVMTTHGTNAFDGSFQTYGACDTGSPKRDDQERQ